METLDGIICDLKERWEMEDEELDDNVGPELERRINKISEIDLRKQVIEYFWNEITSW